MCQKYDLFNNEFRIDCMDFERLVTHLMSDPMYLYEIDSIDKVFANLDVRRRGYFDEDDLHKVSNYNIKCLQT